MATEEGVRVSSGNDTAVLTGIPEETTYQTLRNHIRQQMDRIGCATGAVPIPNTVPTEYLFVNNQGLVLKKWGVPVTVADLSRVSGYLCIATDIMLKDNINEALRTEAGSLLFQQMSATADAPVSVINATIGTATAPAAAGKDVIPEAIADATTDETVNAIVYMAVDAADTTADTTVDTMVDTTAGAVVDANANVSASAPSFEVNDAEGHTVAIGDDEQSTKFGLLRMIGENMVRLNRTRAAVLTPKGNYLFVNGSTRGLFVNGSTHGVAINGANAFASLNDIHLVLSYLMQVTVERLDIDLSTALALPVGQRFLKSIQERAVLDKDGQPGNWLHREDSTVEPKPDNVCVFVESPYSKVDNSMEANRDAILRSITYLNWCFIDSQARGEMPVASHMTMTMHPMSLDRWVCDYDERYDLLTRDGAIKRAQALRKLCACTVFYIDRGMSKGMLAALEQCKENGWKCEMRQVSYPLIAHAYPKITTGFFNAKLMLNCVRSETLAIPYTALFGHNMTLALAKPDVSSRFKEIELMPGFQQFEVVRRVKIQLTRAQVELFYEEHKGAEHFAGLVDFMVSGPVIAYWLTKAQTGDSQTPPAFRMWRELCGPTNPVDAKAALGDSVTTIRGIFGTSLPRNAVHGSDSIESAARELNLFFKDEKDAFCCNSGSTDIGSPTKWRAYMREQMVQCLV